MPRFYFNVHDGKSGLDMIGTELSDCRAARIEAIRLAGEILKDEAPHIALDNDWRTEVTGHRGLVLFQIALLMTETPLPLRGVQDQEDGAR